MQELTASIKGLMAASDLLEADAPNSEFLNGIVQRGLFRPIEHEQLIFWFARYLSIRANIWEVINEAVGQVEKTVQELESPEDWKSFLVAYCAACLLVRNDRIMLFQVAENSIVQRKLNEASSDYRIPRKEYTRIFSAYVDSRDALQIYKAMRVADKNRADLLALERDSSVGFLVTQLPRMEAWLDPSRRHYLKWLSAYVSHKWRRKGVVSLTRSLAVVMEGFGRAASELSVQESKRVDKSVIEQLAKVLLPGDVLVTRHDLALTNLFLPGFWPHVALYVGVPEQRDELELVLDDTLASKWSGFVCVLEALKDGVRFRQLDETLAVDNVIVLRPSLSRSDLREAILRAIKHEGKPYNFDFDFFSAERLVCTEVVYRAFDGLGGVEFPLSLRAGRYSLSAEDILNYALDTGKLVPVAIYGTAGCRDVLVADETVTDLVRKSYQITGK